MKAATTIVLLSVDEAGMLERSLPAALAQEGAEVLVVDNASTDATGDLARRHGARLLRLEPRRSYAAAINAGLAEARAPGVLVLNADCFLDSGALAAARPVLDEPGVGSVAFKLRRDGAEDTIDAAGMWLDRRRKNGLVAHGAPVSALRSRVECFGPDGAAALYRREALDACALPPGAPGGPPEVLDEDLALWATDADLAWRLRLTGWRCVLEPAAGGAHVRTYSPSTRSQVARTHRRLQFRNRYLMWVKDETARGLLSDLPWILLYEVAALGYCLVREPHLLAGYRDAARGLPAAWRRRRLVQERRVTSRVPFNLRPGP